MSKVDEELSRRFHGAERPVETEGLFDGLGRRRSRRRTLQRVQAGALAVTVLAATVGGFLGLRAVFRESGRDVGEQAPLPSNGLIVFERWENEQRSHLYTMRPDGSDVGQLTDFATSDGEPAVSPDGRIVAFVHELEDRSPVIGSIPIEGGVVSWLTDERLFVTGGPTWSPDGERIAFAAHDGDGQRLFVMNANGTEQQAITGDDVHWVDSAAWSPDGSLIAFTASPLSGDDDPSVWDVFTIRPDGTDLTNVTTTADTDEGAVTWSPDSERLAYSLASGQGSSIVVRALVDGTFTSITDGSDLDTSPAWSPDGSLIAFDRAPASGGGYDVWTMRPDGTEPTRLTTGGGFGAAWQPIPVGSSVEPEPGDSLAEGRDIGLGFNLCNVERLGGIDFLGDDTRGIAWTGARLKQNGDCPEPSLGERYLVAADVDGDGSADTFSETLQHCFFCRPFDATDLDADGKAELVVLHSEGSTPSFMIYGVTDGAIAPLEVAEPGHPEARIRPDAPLSFATGGDEGFSGWVRCEGFPAAPVLVVTWRDHPVEGDVMEVHETRLVLQADGSFHVVGATDYEAPVGDEIPNTSDAPACGVDWQIWT